METPLLQSLCLCPPRTVLHCSSSISPCHGLVQTLRSSQAFQLHGSLSLCLNPPSLDPSLPHAARLTIFAGRRSGNAKSSRLKDLPRKRSRDQTGNSGVESLRSSQQVSEKLREEEIVLRDDQATGLIVSAQAYFMRVIVQRVGNSQTDGSTTLGRIVTLSTVDASIDSLSNGEVCKEQEAAQDSFRLLAKTWQGQEARDNHGRNESSDLLRQDSSLRNPQTTLVGLSVHDEGQGLKPPNDIGATPQGMRDAMPGSSYGGNHSGDDVTNVNTVVEAGSFAERIFPTQMKGKKIDHQNTFTVENGYSGIEVPITGSSDEQQSPHASGFSGGNYSDKQELTSFEKSVSEEEKHLQAGLRLHDEAAAASIGFSPPKERDSVNGIFPANQHIPHTDTEGKIGMELLCVVRALLKKIKQKVMVGDKVLVSGIDWTDRRGMIEEVLDRKTEISDPPVANVDQLLVLFSMDRPRIEPMSLSRFLVEAESTGVPFTLILNKSDLLLPKEIDEWDDRLLSWGYKPVFCSVDTRFGVAPLASLLTNRTSVIIGPSGVGKSSLINVLGNQAGINPWNNSVVKDCAEESSSETLDSDMAQKRSAGFEEQMVGEVSERSGRGRHTTRNVTLLRLPSGGYLADTPGFNQPGLVKVTSKSLAQLFPEVRTKISESKSGGCGFSDCLHVGEPDCVVGGDWERYMYYLQFLDELKKRERIELKTFGTKRESELRYKVGALGVKQPEPRLVPKKHRRISRHQVKQQIATEVAEDVEEEVEGPEEALMESMGELSEQDEAEDEKA